MDTLLYEKLLKAARQAFEKLFREHEESFYYCTLITTGEGNCPYISAWSWEALKDYLEQNEIPEEEELDYKWSYADSPYCVYGWDYFKEVESYVNRHKPGYEVDMDTWEAWVENVLDTMEQVMRTLDEQGIFGTGEKRRNMMVNAEVTPPDHTNTWRALRLNGQVDIQEWLEEAAEGEGSL